MHYAADATILSLLGLNQRKLTHLYQAREQRLSDLYDRQAAEDDLFKNLK
jgi:hypothetical protein